MRCATQQRDGATTTVTVVSTSGLGDTGSNVTTTVTAIAAAASGPIVLDMARVSSLDSYELGDLIGAQQAARERDSSITLRDVQPRVREVLETMTLAKVFGLVSER